MNLRSGGRKPSREREGELEAPAPKRVPPGGAAETVEEALRKQLVGVQKERDELTLALAEKEEELQRLRVDVADADAETKECREALKDHNDRIAEGRWPEEMLAVLARVLRTQLLALARNDEHAEWRTTLEGLLEYDAAGWVETRRAGCPALVELLETVLDVRNPDITVEESNRRRKCLVTSLDAAVKGVRHSWLSPMGCLAQWTLYGITRSDLAARILSAIGFGAPMVPPQKAAYEAVCKELEGSTMVVARKTNCLVYADNTQSGYAKTTRQRVGEKTHLTVTTAIEVFHLMDTAMPLLVADRDCHPSAWQPFSKLSPEFFTPRVGDRSAVLEEWTALRWSNAFEEALERRNGAAQASGGEVDTAPATPSAGIGAP